MFIKSYFVLGWSLKNQFWLQSAPRHLTCTLYPGGEGTSFFQLTGFFLCFNFVVFLLELVGWEVLVWGWNMLFGMVVCRRKMDGMTRQVF